jgi:hypothetical protein
MGKIAYYVEEDATGEQPWVLIGLDIGWAAAYRVRDQGDASDGRLQILELRIVPSPFGRDARRAFDSRRRTPVAPLTPFSFDTVRRITARSFDDAVAALVTMPAIEGEAPGEWRPRAEREQTRARRGPGRPSRPRTFYAEFAVRYDDIENNDNRERQVSTREILRRKYKVPLTTIGKWIRVARECGFLTAVTRGQRGGRATPAARALVQKGHRS